MFISFRKSVRIELETNMLLSSSANKIFKELFVYNFRKVVNIKKEQ